MKTVYLAGPITGEKHDEANQWRGKMIYELRRMGIKGISPLRSEPKVGDRYELFYDDDCFGTPKAIAGKNYFDVRNCDLTLAYLPHTSVGTIVEIGWAKSLGKPVVVVSQTDGLFNHPLIEECTNWIVPDFDRALTIIDGLLGEYTR